MRRCDPDREEKVIATTISDQLLEPRATILVVDDSAAMRRYLTTLLELDSYRVETASNGSEALRRVREGRSPAAVLLDLQMPGMNGLETPRNLRKLQPDLKVIICSGLDDPRILRRAAQMGAQDYLIKPVKHLYLSAALERCLGLTGAPVAGGAPVANEPFAKEKEFGHPAASPV